MKLQHHWILHGLSLLLISTLLIYYFFCVGKYQEDPWYFTADADVVFAAQTISLLNDGDLTFLHHPGTTVYSLQVGIHRLLAFFNQEHYALLELSSDNGRPPLDTLLNTAVQTGRLLTIPLLISLAAVIYFLLLKITHHWLIAFSFTFFIVLSKSLLRHVGILRAETSSVLYFSLAVLFFIIGISSLKAWRFWIALVFSGLFLGLAMYSKIQILPAIAVVIPIAAVWFLVLKKQPLFPVSDLVYQRANVGVAIINLLTAPYWALSKPSFLTPETYSRMDPNNQAVYGRFGSDPVRFWLPVLVLMVFFLLLSVCVILFRKHIRQDALVRLVSISLIINLLVFGVIASCYLILLPASMTLEGYTSNTNQLLYSTLTNLMSGGSGFLRNSQVSFVSNFLQIFALHQLFSSIATINILFLVGVAALVCLIRLLTSKESSRFRFAIPLYLFAAGFLIDNISMLRLGYGYSIYAIYSVIFYGVGLALIIWLELINFSLNTRPTLNWIGLGLLAVGIINLGTGSYSILIERNPVKENSYTESQAWNMINVYIPQLVLFDRFSALRQQVCLSPKNLIVGLQEEQNLGEGPDWVWDMSSTQMLDFRNSQSGSLGINDFEISPERYPIFSPSSGGVLIYPQGSSQESRLPASIDNMTISLWVKILDDPDRSGEESRTLLFGYNDTSLDLFLINRYPTKLIIGYYGGEAVGAPLNYIFRSVWNHFVLTKNQNSLKIYINGKNVGSTEIKTTSVLPGQAPGINLWRGSRTATFEVASISLWHEPLNDEQIQRLFQRQVWGLDSSVERILAGDRQCEDLAGISPREFIRAEGEARR